MDAIRDTAARACLAQIMDKVCADHAPVIITRAHGPAVVMLALDDFRSLEETMYLLHSSANARRLLESIAELESGKAVEPDTRA